MWNIEHPMGFLRFLTGRDREAEDNGSMFIPFKDTDPMTFEEYLGQDHIKTRLQLRINTMTRSDSLRMLLSAPAGLGKTAFARVVANEMASKGLIDNYNEIVASNIETKSQLDAFMRTVKPFSFVFIDEIHGLQGLSRDAMLPVLQDNVYAFNEKSMTRLPEGITWVGATTDVGKVHAALQRRLLPMRLDPMAFDDRFILASSLPVPLTEKAALEVAKRCWTPWEIKDEIYVVATDIAAHMELDTVTLDCVLRAAKLIGIDEHGLRSTDRVVLQTLFDNPRTVGGRTVYRMSARTLAATCGLDMPTLLDRVEPRLLAHGYMMVSSGGRELTPKALDTFFKP